MQNYSEVLKIAGKLISLEHLGGKEEPTIRKQDQAELLYQNVQTAFEGINQSLLLDSTSLKRMNRIASIAICCSLLFLLVCLILVLTNLTTIAVVSGMFSLAANVMTVLVFHREDRIRQSATSQMQDFSSLYSMSVLFEFCQGIEDQGARDKAIAKLIADFSAQCK